MERNNSSSTSSYFWYSLFFLCITYFIFSYFYVSYEALGADEFVFARHIYDYTQHIPYRDFPPYKTVLGYYLLSIPMFFSHGLLQPLFYIKQEIALINTICLLLAAYFATNLFDRKAVFISILAIIANQFFITYSTELRVDMLTAWICLFSALAILHKRIGLSGLLMGLAFLISQKALWYIVAINGAMVLCWFSWRKLITFNVFLFIPIVLYIAAWSLVASPNIILSNLLYDAYIQAGISWYVTIYLLCWNILLYHGPILFLLWPLTFIPFIVDPALQRNKDSLFILCFASLALLQFVIYKQPFPYNFVFTVPAFFFLYANFFNWWCKRPIAVYQVSWLSAFNIMLYTFAMASLVYFFDLPTIYFLIMLLPILTCLSLFSNAQIQIFYFTAWMIIFTITGVLYPLYHCMQALPALSGAYQRSMLEITEQLTGNDSSYIGGIPFLYQKDQPVEGLKNLIGPSVEYLYNQDPNLKPLLLPSLYLTATTSGAILQQLQTAPVKVFINNYRIIILPPEIRHYFYDHYQHYYGSLYLYAPVIKASHFDLLFTGNYRFLNKEASKIDGQTIQPGQILFLTAGRHVTNTKQHYRLAWVPQTQHLNPLYKEDNWLQMIKAIAG